MRSKNLKIQFKLTSTKKYQNKMNKGNRYSYGFKNGLFKDNKFTMKLISKLMKLQK